MDNLHHCIICFCIRGHVQPGCHIRVVREQRRKSGVSLIEKHTNMPAIPNQLAHPERLTNKQPTDNDSEPKENLFFITALKQVFFNRTSCECCSYVAPNGKGTTDLSRSQTHTYVGEAMRAAQERKKSAKAIN